MDQDDPEKRIAELERQLASGRRGELPGAAGQPRYPAPPAPYGTGSGTPHGAPYGMGPAGAGFQRWQRRRPWRVTRLVWILVVFWLVMIPMGNILGAVLMHLRHQSFSTLTAVPQGGVLSVGGNGESDTIMCNDGTLVLSGNNNTFTVTGHCVSLSVSGNQNHVTVDSADTIDAGGIGTVTTYHSGTPKITNSGINVTVNQG
jgi:hypothetical protein